MKIKFRNYGAFRANVELVVMGMILVVLMISLMCIPLKLIGLVPIGWMWIFAPWVILITCKVFTDVFEVVEDVKDK